MSDAGKPSVEARHAFVRKLGQFRQSLPPEEQGMLDTLIITALGKHRDADVEGYGWFYGGNTGNPTFYDAGMMAPGETTDWWTTYTKTGPWSNNPI